MDTPKKEATGTPSSASSRVAIENMSHEDLVKTNKKQLMFLQKLKAKCNDLQSKLASQADYQEIKSQFHDAKEKLTDLSEEVKVAHESHKEVARAKHSLNEEVDCLKQKQETLLSSLQCLQADYDNAAAEKKTLNEQIKRFVEESNEHAKNLDDVKNELQDVNDQMSDKNQQLRALKEHIKKLKESEEKSKQFFAKLGTENKETKTELAAMKISLEMFKKSNKSLEEEDNVKVRELNSKVKVLQEELSNIHKRNENLTKQINEFESVDKEQSTKLEVVSNKCSELSKKIARSGEENDDLKEKLKLKQLELETSKKHAQEKESLAENSSVQLREVEISLTNALEEQTRLKDVNFNLTKEMEQLQSTMCNNNEKIDEEISKEMISLRDKLSQVQSELDNSIANVQNREELLIKAENNFESEKLALIKNHDEEISELRLTIEGHDATINGLTNELGSEKAHVADFASLHNELKNENNSLCLKINELQETLDTKERAMHALQCSNQTEEVTDQIKLDYDVAMNECEALKLKVASSEENEKSSAEKFTSLEEDYNLLGKRNEEIETEKTSLQEKLKQKMETCDCLTTSSASLQEEVQKLRDIAAKSKDEFEKLSTINSQMKTELEISLHDYKCLKETANFNENKRSAEVDELQSHVQNYQVKLNNSEDENTRLQSELEQIRSDCSISLEKLQSLDMQLEEMRGLRKDLENQNSVLQQECRVLKEEIQELANNQTSVAESAEAMLQSSNAAMKIEVQRLTDELNVVTSQSHELSVDGSKLHEVIADLTNQNQDFAASLTSKNEEVQKLIVDLETTGRELAEIEKKLNEEIIKLQSQVTELQGELQSHQQSQELFQSEQTDSISQYQSKLDETNSQKEKLQSLLDKMKEVNEKKEQDVDDLNHKVKLLEASVEESTRRIKQLSEEVSCFQEMLQQSNVMHHEEITKIESDRSDEIQRLQLEFTQTKEKLLDLENEISRKQDDLDDLSESFADEQSASTQLHQDNDALNNQVQTLLCEIESLKGEVARLKSEPTEEKHKGNKTELESLQKSIKEKETYSSKLKVIAVKAKKELDTVKGQLQSTIEENNQLQNRVTQLNSSLLESKARIMSGAQTLQVECDRLQDEIDQIKSEKSELQKVVDDSKIQITNLISQKEESISKLSASLLDIDRVKSEKSDVEHVLFASKSHVSKLEKEKEALMKDKNSMKQEVEACRIQVTSLTKQLEEKQESLTTVESSLVQANKHNHQHDLMSLEMAQYEATLCGLQTQVSDLEAIVQDKDEKVNDFESKVSELNSDRKAVEELRLDAEDRVTRTKEALDSTREQVARLSELEHECKGQVDNLTEQLEHSQQLCEEYKLSLSSKTSECRKLEEQLSTLKIRNQKSTDVLDRKIKHTQEELERIRSEKEALYTDYESYKVRVHSVLKQQKNKEVHNVEEDARISVMKSQLVQLQSKLVESQNVLTSRDHELDLLQGDYDRLLRQQQQSSEGALERETRWKSRVKTLQQELVALRKQHDDVTIKLAQQRDVMAESVASAVELAKTEHEAELSLLHAELKRRETELVGMRNEAKKLAEEKLASSHTKRPAPSPKPYRPHVATEASVDYRSVAREAGEGEEQMDDDSMVSFEQILQSPRIQSVTEMRENESVTSEMQIKHLETKFVAQRKQLEHSTEVARESEATASRLADQNRVLKEEIRRLEKNQERDKSVSNMEYLKNVIYKFLTLPPCDERTHLVPVIDTMLRLNKDERAVIEALATGDDSADDQKASGWGGYLQRWSGMQ